MNADIQMVPMQEKHIPALAQLERLCFSQPWTESGLRSELHNKLAVFCVAEQNGQVLGYAGMQCVMGECYINNIAVFPQFRGMGIEYPVGTGADGAGDTEEWSFYFPGSTRFQSTSYFYLSKTWFS